MDEIMYEIKSAFPAQAGTVAVFENEENRFHYWRQVHSWALIEFLDEPGTHLVPMCLGEKGISLEPASIMPEYMQVIDPGKLVDYLGEPLENGYFENEEDIMQAYEEIMDAWGFGADVPAAYREWYHNLVDAMQLDHPGLRLKAVAKAIGKIIVEKSRQSYLNSLMTDDEEC